MQSRDNNNNNILPTPSYVPAAGFFNNNPNASSNPVRPVTMPPDTTRNILPSARADPYVALGNHSRSIFPYQGYAETGLETSLSRLNLSSSPALMNLYLSLFSPEDDYLNMLRVQAAARGHALQLQHQPIMYHHPRPVNQNGRMPAIGHNRNSMYNSSSPGPRSQFLNFPLQEIKGKIANLSKWKQGSHYLLNKLAEGNQEDFYAIFSEMKGRVCELMMNQCSSSVLQTLFDMCTTDDVDLLSEILHSVTTSDDMFKRICLDINGARAVQKLLEKLCTSQQRCLFVEALRRATLCLSKSPNGYPVIEHFFQYFSNEEIQVIVNEVSKNCMEFALHRYACCFLQNCLGYAGDPVKQILINVLIANAAVLSEHAFGNYVVQRIMDFGEVNVTTRIVAELSGSYVTLSLNKFGSNVVQKCLGESDDNQATMIIAELMYSPDFLKVVQSPFGNYVAQTALQVSKGTTRNILIEQIKNYYASIHSHPYGKRVLAGARGAMMNRRLVFKDFSKSALLCS